jgi:hypothetical protein
VEVDATSRAPCIEANLVGHNGAALRAADDLAEARHVDVLGAVLRGKAARALWRARLRRGSWLRRLWPPIAIVILVAALTVLPVAH